MAFAAQVAGGETEVEPPRRRKAEPAPPAVVADVDPDRLGVLLALGGDFAQRGQERDVSLGKLRLSIRRIIRPGNVLSGGGLGGESQPPANPVGGRGGGT